MLAGDRRRSPGAREPGRARPCTRCRAAARPPRGRRASRAPTGSARRRRGRGARRPRSARRRSRRARRPSACGPSPSGTCSRAAARTRARGSARRPRASSGSGRPASGGGRGGRAGARGDRCETRAPSASSAAAGSEGCAEAQKSFAKIACSRCCPARAWQTSPPCSRHGNCRRQYQQRVDCSRLPPIVPMLRSCGEAASRQASRSASGIVVVVLELGERRPRADRRSADAARHDVRDLDEPLGVHEPVAQLRHELRASRQRLVARFAAERRELLERARPNQLQRALALVLHGGPAGSPRA